MDALEQGKNMMKCQMMKCYRLTTKTVHCTAWQKEVEKGEWEESVFILLLVLTFPVYY